MGIPKNSAGRLPWELLSMAESSKVEAARAVARQANQVSHSGGCCRQKCCCVKILKPISLFNAFLLFTLTKSAKLNKYGLQSVKLATLVRCRTYFYVLIPLLLQMLLTLRARFSRHLLHRPYDLLDQDRFDEIMQVQGWDKRETSGSF